MKSKISIVSKYLIVCFAVLLVVAGGVGSQIHAQGEKSYLVNFEFNNDTNTSTTDEIKEGDLITGTPVVTPKEGYVFVGWAKAFDNDKPILWDFEKDKMPNHNITLWAVYKNAYLVNFEFEDGKNTSTTDEIGEGDLITGTPVVTPEKGYIFVGWAKAFDNDEPILWDFEKDKMPNHNITLWAVYKNTYLVNFEFEDGKNTSTTIEVGEGDLITGTPVVTPEKGYIFVGWAKAFDNDKPILWDFEKDKMPNHNITLWAAYEEIITIDYISAIVNGAVDKETSTKITITLSKDIEEFSLDNIILSSSTRTLTTLNKDTLTSLGNGKYELTISGTWDEGTKVNVVLEKNGIMFSPDTQTVTLHKKLNNDSDNDGNNGNNGNPDPNEDELTDLPITGSNIARTAIIVFIVGLLVSGGYLFIRRSEQ